MPEWLWILIFVSFLAVTAQSLECEVAFQSRTWFPTDAVLQSVTSSTEPTTTTTIGPPKTEIYNCSLQTNHAASFACGELTHVIKGDDGSMFEVVLRDCVGYLKELPPPGQCPLTNFIRLADQGIFFFHVEHLFADYLVDVGIANDTEIVGCFCTTDKCNHVPVGGQIIVDQSTPSPSGAIEGKCFIQWNVYVVSIMMVLLIRKDLY